jgi:glycosyltransferase involved in cell wall biosynthesis
MRIAFLVENTINGLYRCAGPMHALRARGHDVRQLDLASSAAWPELIRWCEVIHIHRICDGGVLDVARAARASGSGIVWDDDDDVTSVARDAEAYRAYGGLSGQRYLAARRRLFELVDLVTTPSEWLAQSFADAGAPRVRVLENYVVDEFVRSAKPPSSGGITIGWTAADEHRADLAQIPIRPALARLLDEHDDVHVRTIGVPLGIRHPRYEHVKSVPFPRLPQAAATFDIGIAPLSAQVALNRARSNIKLKEYAALGIPWLASPVGPYAGLGSREGGRLVPDDRWYEQLEDLVTNARARRKLTKAAARWGRKQTISRNVGLWEQALTDVVRRARAA